MADSKPKSGSPPAPSFYSAAAGMDGKPSSSPSPTTGAGKEGEKVQQIEKLLEVIQMLDKQEAEQDGKAMIQAISDAAKKYLDKIKGAGGKPNAQPVTGEAGSGGMAPEPPMAGGAGGAGGSVPGGMAA